MSSEEKNKKGLTDSHRHQIAVLRAMSLSLNANLSPVSVSKVITPTPETEPKRYQIHEIAEMSGLRDEKETQRYLFILEGQKLVSPCPAGDFTSKTWHITKHGIKAIKTIQKTHVQ